jgi:hypothetical protein
MPAPEIETKPDRKDKMKKQQKNARFGASNYPLRRSYLGLGDLAGLQFRSVNWSSPAADAMEMPIRIADQAITTLGNNIYGFSGTTGGLIADGVFPDNKAMVKTNVI